MKINTIINEINNWLAREQELGSHNPQRIVLATAGKNNIPHSRVVAIREISAAGVLFFTQRGTRKVTEMQENPSASMTLWLPQQQRQVIIEGHIQSLTLEENETYWNLLPFDRKIRFSAYSPTSGQPIDTLTTLENKAYALEQHFNSETIPMSPYYCGFRLIPETFYLYTLGEVSFSEVIKYFKNQDEWLPQQLSP